MYENDSLAASALSRFYFRINRFQLHASVVDLKLPIDSALSSIAVLVPGRGFFAKLLDSAEATTRDALAGHRTEFILGDVQPTAVPGRVAKLQTPHQ